MINDIIRNSRYKNGTGFIATLVDKQLSKTGDEEKLAVIITPSNKVMAARINTSRPIDVDKLDFINVAHNEVSRKKGLFAKKNEFKLAGGELYGTYMVTDDFADYEVEDPAVYVDLIMGI